MTAGPANPVSAPRPLPPRFNLFTVAQAIPDGVRWGGGIVVDDYPAGPGGGWDPCGLGTFRPKDDGADASFSRPEFNAFVAYLAGNCSAVGIGPFDTFADRVEAALAALEPFHAERQLSQGDYLLFNSDPNPYLADANADNLGTSAPMLALAKLETAIAETGVAGVIHATPGTVTAWSALSAVTVDGGFASGVLRTYNGTPVVSGAGYVGADLHAVVPSAPSLATGKEWAFATGPLLYGRAPFLRQPVSEVLDRSDNTIVYRAERDLLVAWDTHLQAAVLVDRT